jgi:PEP-CTERM motif/Cleaved Adhesin Domain
MMKKALAAMAIAAITMSAQAGVLINEGFDNVAGLAASGWTFADASTPGGATPGWFPGTNGVFSEQAGGADSFIAAKFSNAPAGGTVDNWLITPEFDASRGVDISFWLRAAGEGFTDNIAYGFAGASLQTIVSPVPDSAWTQYTVHVDANTLGTTRFAFRYFGDADSLNYVGLDSVTVTSPGGAVPEPASLALFAGGMLALGALRRRVR